MSNALDRGWGSGCPLDRRRDMAKVTAGGGASVWVHRDIAPITLWLMTETERRGYKLNTGQCWGYCNRTIRGSTSPSNHSWGLAVDLNAPANPMSARLITDMPEWMPPLWTEHGFAWGGAYRGRKDAMHYEFMGIPAEARAIAARLGAPDPICARRGPEEVEKFMYDPPLVLEPIVADLSCPDGGGWLLAASGAVYAVAGAPFHGGANQQEYFVNRRAARLEPRDGGGYTIVATSGETYNYP